MLAPVQAFVEVFCHFGIEPTMEEVRKPMGMLKRDHIRTMLQMKRIFGLWKEKYGADWTEDDVEKLTLCLRRNFWESSISLQK